MEVDVDPLDSWAIDRFTLYDVAVAAEKVYEGCLKDRGLVGLEYPQREGIKRVWAKIVRINSPPIYPANMIEGIEGENGELRKIKVGNLSGELVIADRRFTAFEARRIFS